MPHDREQSRHSILALLLTFVGAVVVNLLIFSYYQGKLEHRIQVLEKQDEQWREDWKAARERIEKVIDKLEEELSKR